MFHSSPTPSLANIQLNSSTRRQLLDFAADTWRSFEAMALPSGLPADSLQAGGPRTEFTSPSNIAAYLWSTLAARDLGIISEAEANRSLDQTLKTLVGLERHPAGGQFYNWYDAPTGTTLHRWPPSGGRLYPFLSSVDNGWLAAALLMVRNGAPRFQACAEALLASFDFGFYYNPDTGLLRGGCWPESPPWTASDGGFTRHHYDVLNTETRIASYLAIAWGQVPASHYFKLGRGRPADGKPGNGHLPQQQRMFMDEQIHSGKIDYYSLKLVPSWGGSMFEALMVPLFVPEEQWAPLSWGLNHPSYAAAQIHHGMIEAGYGYWGFSPAWDPAGGYREFGVSGIGLYSKGYPSHNGHSTRRNGSRARKRHREGIITPHAVFLALDFAPQAALENLANLQRDFPIYGPYGFWDSVNVATGQVSDRVLALDQGMIMASIANALTGDRLQSYFFQGEIERVLRPLLGIEEFFSTSQQEPAPPSKIRN